MLFVSPVLEHLVAVCNSEGQLILTLKFLSANLYNVVKNCLDFEF